MLMMNEEELKKENKKIKILVCYHKPSFLLKDDILTPIHVGRSLARKRMDSGSEAYTWLMTNCIGDDTGENISDKNSSYNEMTSLYWAWKNYDKLGNPDYIGMMHYRRHFMFRKTTKTEGEIRFDEFEEKYYLDQIGYSKDNLEKFVEGLDYVVHLGRVNNVYKHYCDSHKKEDLDVAAEIIKELYPEYTDSMEEYFEGDVSNFCNMFILKRDLFFRYCEFVFSVLEEFEKKVDISEKRLFISERVTGVFFAHLMKDEQLNYKSLPITFIDEPVTAKILLQQTENSLYPLAVSLQSLILNKKEKSKYEIVIVLQNELKDYEKYALEKIIEDDDKVLISYQQLQDDENIVQTARRIFNDEKKCLVISDGTIVLNDLTDFFGTVSVDDYYVVGVPVQGYYAASKEKYISSEVLVINLNKTKEKNIVGINNEYTGYIPSYYVTAAGSEDEPGCVFDSHRSRKQIVADSSWKRMILFDDYRPWENPQKALSYYWWNVASKMDVALPFPECYGDGLIELLNEQQKEINLKGSNRETYVNYQGHQEIVVQNEEWRNYNMLGKLKFYYDHNGLKQTIVYCFNKYIFRRHSA